MRLFDFFKFRKKVLPYDIVPLSDTAKLPPVKDSQKLPNDISEFKEWHYKALRRLNKHPAKEPFSGFLSLEVDMPKFITLAQELDLIDCTIYKESLLFLKNDVLKQILKKYHLKVSGNKQQLVERILANINELEVRSLDIYSDFYKLTPKGQELIKDSSFRFELEHINFFKETVELIMSYQFNDAYRKICKQNAEMPVPPGIGCNWSSKYYTGLTEKKQTDYIDLLNNSSHLLLTAASIYADISGESYERIKYYLHRGFCTEVDVFDFSYESNLLASKQTFASYQNCGIAHYCFLSSLDECTCPICGELDGKIFPVSEKQIGINCPPMHKGCRCTTVSVIDGCIPKERRARNPITKKSELIPFITYSDWVKQFK